MRLGKTPQAPGSSGYTPIQIGATSVEGTSLHAVSHFLTEDTATYISCLLSGKSDAYFITWHAYASTIFFIQFCKHAASFSHPTRRQCFSSLIYSWEAREPHRFRKTVLVLKNGATNPWSECLLSVPALSSASYHFMSAHHFELSQSYFIAVPVQDDTHDTIGTEMVPDDVLTWILQYLLYFFTTWDPPRS